MLIFVFLFVVQVLSLGLAAVALKRLYVYIKRYRFDESTYTLLLGFLHLRYFAFLYVFVVGLAAGLELIYAFSLVT